MNFRLLKFKYVLVHFIRATKSVTIRAFVAYLNDKSIYLLSRNILLSTEMFSHGAAGLLEGGSAQKSLLETIALICCIYECSFVCISIDILTVSRIKELHTVPQSVLMLCVAAY